MARNYVSNKNETVRMFESDFMEFFSHVHPVTPLVIYVPVIIWMFYLGVERGISALTMVGLFVLGVVLWTFIEYTLHRYVFHYQPRTAWGKRLHFMLHGVHHDYPKDATRLVMPPGISIPLALLFYGLFYLVFGLYAPPAFAGMVFGYLCYDMIHYATHHFPMKRGAALWLKQYHMRHHYQDDDTGYGVSSPIWDYVFGTVGKKAEVKE
jgi:sterol desaturase/sphingolipid hydroxylase (fatty acid hydroxylase superfamily)